MAPLDLATATVAELLRDRATEMPDSPFFRCERDWISYLELDQRSKRLAASLAALGVERGDRVAILATNRDAHAELLFAAAKGAMIHVPLNPYLKEDGLMHQLQVTTPRAVIADEDGYAMLERLWPRLSGFVAHVVALEPRASSEERFSSLGYGELLAADGSSGRRARKGDPLAI